MNQLGRSGEAFFFAIDFEQALPIVQPLNTIDPDLLLFNFRGSGNAPSHKNYLRSNITLNPSFVSSKNYFRGFSHVRHEQRLGNSFLANLTCPTELDPDGWDDFRTASLKELFHCLVAPYRLWMKPDRLRPNQSGELLVFSPETFVQSHHGRMYTFPMKGTAFVSQGDDRRAAERRLLENEKEKAEHITVVDLLRNDLGRVASEVCVEEFRALSSIPVEGGQLLQVSSRISARLPEKWEEQIGSIFAALLPAGSVSGAPKRETCRIIAEAEAIIQNRTVPAPRGYYCGVAGIFDGWNLDSCVLIRFIEMHNSAGQLPSSTPRYFFRSGGGITIYSRRKEEYEELKAKVCLPLRKRAGK